LRALAVVPVILFKSGFELFKSIIMFSKHEFKNQTRVKYIDFETYKKAIHYGD